MSSTQAASEGSLGGPRVAPTWPTGLATPGRCASLQVPGAGVRGERVARPRHKDSSSGGQTAGLTFAAPFPDTRKLFAVISGRGCVSVWDFSVQFFFNYF